jgi:hypothetical protein
MGAAYLWPRPELKVKPQRLRLDHFGEKARGRVVLYQRSRAFQSHQHLISFEPGYLAGNSGNAHAISDRIVRSIRSTPRLPRSFLCHFEKLLFLVTYFL